MWGSSSDSARRQVAVTVRNLDAERSSRGPLGPSSSASSQSTTPAPLSMGWLLRLFRSEFFDAWMAVTYLYRYRASRGVHDYLCNELYHLSDADLEAFLPQVCNLLVHHARDSPALERFVMDKCASSLHFAIQVFWFLQAAVEDAVRESNKDAEARCRLLRTRCETAAVNGAQRCSVQTTFPFKSDLSATSQALPTRSASEAFVDGEAASSPTTPSRRHHLPNSTPSSCAKLFPSSSVGHIAMGSMAMVSSRPGGSDSGHAGSRRLSVDNSHNEALEPSANKPPYVAHTPKTRHRTLSSLTPDMARICGANNRDNPLSSSDVAVRAHVHSNSIACSAELQIPRSMTKDDSLRTRLFPSDSDGSLDDVAKAGIAMTSPDAAVGAILDNTRAGIDIASDLMSTEKLITSCNSKYPCVHNTSDNCHEALCRTESDTSYHAASQEAAEKALKTSVRERHTVQSEMNSNGVVEIADRDIDHDNEILESGRTHLQESGPRTHKGKAVPHAARNAGEQSLVSDEDSIRSNTNESPDNSNIFGGRSGNFDQDTALDPMILLSMKQERFDYFNDSLSVVKAFVRLSLALRDVPHDERPGKLKGGLEEVNEILLRRMVGEQPLSPNVEIATPSPEQVARLGESAALRSVHLPLTRAMSPALRILRVISSDAVILTSRTRVPYMLLIEVLPTDMKCCDNLLFCHHVVKDMHRRASEAQGAHSSGDLEPRPLEVEEQVSPSGSETTSRESAVKIITPSSIKLLEKTPAQRQRATVHRAIYGPSFATQVAAFVDLDVLSPDLVTSSSISSSTVIDANAEKKMREAAVLAVYGELWSWKEERILKSSPFHNLRGSKLMPLIVKAGDDLRQEQLAIQLITQFKWIFSEEAVDVYLRPFTVMSVSSDAGFVEVIPDAVSIHSLKKRTPNFVSLLDYFERAYGRIGSRSFRLAQRRFIRSMAGYSLVSYFLQIKDRHNGNIMIDADGHIVHIDFGFMLTNSPGAIKFENVPFKLTEEYLQVICARKSVKDSSETSKTEGYRYFQELFVLGYLAARKHYEKLTTLVEIMMEGTSMPCMSGGHSVVESLRHRFSLGVSEEQCIANALGLIEESRLSWRSASYDHFQMISNGYA